MGPRLRKRHFAVARRSADDARPHDHYVKRELHPGTFRLTTNPETPGTTIDAVRAIAAQTDCASTVQGE
jgi:hypothetical protein